MHTIEYGQYSVFTLVAADLAYIIHYKVGYIVNSSTLEFATANGEIEFVPLQQNTGLGGSAVRLIVQTGREGLHRFLWLHSAIAMHIGNIMCCAEQMVGID